MSLYAQYIMEITNDFIIERDYGFATYRYLNEGNSVYIIDIFVIPQERNKRRSNDLADIIVKEAKIKGCKELLGTISPSSKGATISLRAQLSYGMKLSAVSHDAIILRKDI
jgi:hypothetical protein